VLSLHRLIKHLPTFLNFDKLWRVKEDHDRFEMNRMFNLYTILLFVPVLSGPILAWVLVRAIDRAERQVWPASGMPSSADGNLAASRSAEAAFSENQAIA
jgi:hypothetical protein